MYHGLAAAFSQMVSIADEDVQIHTSA